MKGFGSHGSLNATCVMKLGPFMEEVWLDCWKVRSASGCAYLEIAAIEVTQNCIPDLEETPPAIACETNVTFVSHQRLLAYDH